MLPNFMCIGAQKSGTTTIWHILNAHPDIFMAPARETHFFYDDALYAEGLPVYEIRHFSAWAGQAAAGEKCPEYLYLPEVPARIRKTLGPQMKFIVALRSPAQRAFSQYRHNLTLLREHRSFDAALDQEWTDIAQGKTLSVHAGYISRGYYACQLHRYFELFDQNQFLIRHFEADMTGDQKALAERLYDFLNVGSMYPDSLPFKTGHPRLEHLSVRIDTDHEDPLKHFVEIDRQDGRLRLARQMLNRVKKQDAPGDYEVQRIYNPSETLIRFARDFQRHKPELSALSRTQELEINNRYFKQDIEALSPLVSFDVSHWLAD